MLRHQGFSWLRYYCMSLVRKAASSVYRSPELYVKLRHEIDTDNSSSNVVLGYRCH
ncbi:hypothetical protein Hdeb2414_s0344g00872911 [Helianthus debilis subsp. tardiflorus]